MLTERTFRRAAARARRERRTARRDRRRARDPGVLGSRAGLRDAAAPDPRAAGVTRVREGVLRPARRPRRRRHARAAPRARRTRSSAATASAGRRHATRGCSPTAVTTGDLDLVAVAAAPDDEAHAALVALPGIGPWTADVYLLSAPAAPGRLARRRSSRSRKRRGGSRGSRPARRLSSSTALGERWRPQRATAARLLWHLYLSTPRVR